MNARRTRIVNFRVTEEEYQRLRSASDALGAGGISGYARQATLYLATSRQHHPESTRHAAIPEDVFACLTDLRKRIVELETQVGRLNEMSEAAHGTHV